MRLISFSGLVLCLIMHSLAGFAADAPRYIYKIHADFGDKQQDCNGVATAINWQVITAAHCVATRAGALAHVQLEIGDDSFTATRVVLHKDWLDDSKRPQAGDMALLSLPAKAVSKLKKAGAPRMLSTGAHIASQAIRLYAFAPGVQKLQSIDCTMERVGVRHSRLHNCPTAPGYSGAPIFYISTSTQGTSAVLVGLHTRAAGSKGIARVFTKDELATLLGGADDFWRAFELPKPLESDQKSATADTAGTAPLKSDVPQTG